MKFLIACLLVVNVMCLNNSKPNVIITVGSGVGMGDIGEKNILFNRDNTPNIDKLASEGINYLDFHVGGSSNSPSMAALLTGRHGQRNGVNKMFKPDSVGGLPLSELTLANYLKNSGYITGYIGVWDLGHQAAYLPLARGFDYFYGTPYNPLLGCIHEEGTFVPDNVAGVNLTCDAGKIGVPLIENNTILEQPLWTANISITTLHEKCQRFVDNAIAEDRPFFLIVSPVEINLPAIVQPSSDPNKYLLLNELDQLVGMSQDMLTRYNIAENTISMLSSKTGPIDANCDLCGDVGPFLGMWQVVNDEQSSPTMGTNWEGAVRVPFVFHWPQRIKQSIKNSNLQSSVDILATISDVVNFSLPADRTFDGISLASDWSGKDDVSSRTVYFLEPDTDEVFAFRQDYFKVYFRTNGAKKCNSTFDPSQKYVYHPYPLVFDLSEDKSEFRNKTYDEFHAALFLDIKKIGDELFKNESGFRSMVDYSQDRSATMCCNAQCRCRSNSPVNQPYFPTFDLFVNTRFGDLKDNNTGNTHREIISIYGLFFICLVIVVVVVCAVYKSYNVVMNTKLGLYGPIMNEAEIEKLIITQT